MRIEFDHVHLNSADVGAAVDFYVEKFGGKKGEQFEVAGIQIHVVDFDGIRFLINDRAPSVPPAGTSTDHIGFRVADLDAVATELKRRGAEFLMEPMELGDGVKIAFVSGPDNVMIELSQER